MIHPDVAKLFKDRLASSQLLEEISQLLHTHRNAAFSSGYRAGESSACERIVKYCEEFKCQCKKS